MKQVFRILLIMVIASGCMHLEAQDTTMVTGVIKSSRNEPVPDVSVSIEGSSMMPVVTGEDGTFTIPSVTGKEWLIISPAADFKMRRVYLNGRNELVIYLTPLDLSSGDDRVMVLSRVFPRRDVVPAFTELDIGDISNLPILSVDEQMQGRVPGMHVVNRSGMPGSGAVTTLRGVRSLNATNQPLYMVDGFPLVSHGLFQSNLAGYEYNALMSVNPFDISRVFIFKDPAVGSVFGSRGSNGIIMIETLDPSVTQTSIEVNLRTGYSLTPPDFIPQLNATQHKTLMNEVLFSSGANEEIVREAYPTLFMEEDDERFIDYQHDTHWQELIFNNALLYNMNVKVKGGDEIARYGLSFGYLDSDGIIRNTGYQGYNLRFISRLNIFTWLKMDAGVSLCYNTSNLKESAMVKETSPILTSLAKSPLLNPYQYDVEKRETDILSEVDEIGVSNPLATIENYEAYNSNYSFVAHLGIEGTINRDLSVISRFSFTYDVLKEKIFQPNRGMELYYNDEAINVSKAANNDLTSLYNNTFLRFDRSFGSDHRLTSNTGMYLMNNRYQMDWGLTKNAHENDEYRDLQDGQNNLREIGGQNRLWNWVSFYENLTYAFMDRYMLNASVSLDGSSRVGRKASGTLKLGGEPFGLFYSGGLAWRISDEPFLRNLAWLEDLRIRFTAGRTGNDDFGEATATDYYASVRYRQTVGLYPAVIPNENLTYETVDMIDGGLNLALLGNRVTLDLDYFVSNTGNMVIYTPVEAYLGYHYVVENGGEMQNRGWELGGFFRLINGRHFNWDVHVALSSLENEITDIKGDRLVYDVPGGQKVNQTGAPANSFYGLIYKGVFSTQEEAAEANLVSDRGIAFGAGDAIFEDLSGPGGEPDGVIDGYDKTDIGSPLPDYFGGVINSFSYKGWTLSASLNFVYGNKVFNYVRYQNEKMTGLENQSAHVLNRWQYEGQETDVPRALWQDPVGNSSFSTRWIEDGSFLRVKFIKLSYRIPSQFLMFKNAEFYVSANNILTITGYLGYDPEFSSSFSRVYQGIDYGLTPIPRQFLLGINLGL
jgi:TonB-linked SusC/RagA family outer membrane protein